jgi:hypothetical protein
MSFESIDLSKLDFHFSSKPLLIGGKAMEYYGLRQAGKDIDMIVTQQDYERLAAKYPESMREIWGDLGVCRDQFEIWRSICLFDYEFYLAGALTNGDSLVVSLEKLVFMKALDWKNSKAQHDITLIVKKILDDQYKNFSSREQS